MPKYLRFVFLPMILVLLGLTACTQKKEVRFPFGEGQGLLKISDYENKQEKLVTTERNGNLIFQTADKAERVVDGKTQNFAYFKYQTTAEFFPKEMPFIAAKSNQEYNLLYQLIGSNLVISKLVTAEESPIEERASVTMDKQLNRFMIPIVTYKILQFVKVDQARDESDEKTSRLKEFVVGSKDQATHFRIDINSKNIIGLKEKKNIFRKDIFQGTWFTSSVISKIGEEKSEYLGANLSYDFEYGTADKIIFTNSQGQIIGLNASYDNRIKLENDLDKRIHLNEAISFPVRWIHYKRDLEKGTFEEIEMYEKKWDERDFVEVDFTGVTSPITKALVGTPTLIDLVVTDNFIMFSLQFTNQKVTISFLKQETASNDVKLSRNKYSPRRYFSEDLKYFGFFTTAKKSLNTYEKYRREDFEKFTFMNRFHPLPDAQTGRRKIEFYLTDASPTDPEIIDTVRASIKTWDSAFKEVGLQDVDIVFNESKKVAVGDLRYNSINLIKTLTSSSLFGFGPSVADPDTGEIISATTNVHITSIKTHLIDQLRNYIRYRRGDLDRNYPLRKLGLHSGDQAGGFQSASIASTLAQKADKHKMTVHTYSKHRCDFESSSGNLKRDIESDTDLGCKKLKDYASQPENDFKIEAQALEECAQHILPKKVQATLVHELGHNFGLRHNFAASADSANYAKKRDTKTNTETSELLARSSSVMEYTDFNEDRLTQLGPYDIEAIRFGYANRLQDNKLQVHELDINQSIDMNLKRLGVTKRPLRFCTDEHVELGMDPMCQRHDTGDTPLAIVQSLIARYNTFFATQNFRYDREKSLSANMLKEMKEQQIFNRLRMIYEQWRINLTGVVGIDNQSLEVYDEQSLKKELFEQSLKDDPYRQAADKIFEFLSDLTFLPSKYCLVKSKDPNSVGSKYSLIELSNLIAQDKTASSNDSLAQDQTKTDENECKKRLAGNLEYIDEVGFFFDNQQMTKDRNEIFRDYEKSRGKSNDNLDSYWDIVGIKDDKELAKDFLTTRVTDLSAQNFISRRQKIYPSMLDEPEFRRRFTDQMIDRVLKGIQLKHVTFKDESKDSILYFPKWHEEFNHLRQTWEYMQTGVSVRDKAVMNRARNIRWQVIKTDNQNLIESAKEKMPIERSDEYVLAMSEENDVAIKLIRRLKWLNEERKNRTATYLRDQIDYDAQHALISFILSI